MRWTLLTLLLLAVSAPAETWRWVDENGVVNFSDQPRPGAERVELEEVSTFSPPEWANPDRQSSSETAGSDEPDGAGTYSRVAVLSPAPDETIWNAEGTLDVALEVDPRVRRGDRVHLYLDGERVTGLPANATRFTINRVFRGGHTLRATVENRKGEELATSDTTQFFVQRTTLLNPNRNPATTPPTPQPRPRPRGGG